FTLVSPTVTVNQNSAAFTRAKFAAFGPGGGADEAGQTATYTLANTNTALFIAQPAIAPNGTLTFTPAPGASGTATLIVNVTDSGTPNATSPPQFLTITVNAAPPVVAPPIITPPVTVSAAGQYIAIGSDAGVMARVRVLDAHTNQLVRELFP